MSPIRLETQREEKSFREEFVLVLINHANFILPFVLVLLVLGIMIILCGMCAVESGMMRNFMTHGV